MSDLSLETINLVKAYELPDAARELVDSTDIMLLSGSTGAGKNSIAEGLIKLGGYLPIVSHTTREPRENDGALEQQGVDYFFVDVPDMIGLLKSGALIEAKVVHKRDIYGTSVAQIQEAHDFGLTALADVDVQGVAEYKAISPDVLAMFIIPPSFDEWMKRLQLRYGAEGMPPDLLQKRLRTAIDEFQVALSSGYYNLVINDNLDEAVRYVDALNRGESDSSYAEKAAQLARVILGQIKAATK